MSAPKRSGHYAQHKPPWGGAGVGAKKFSQRIAVRRDVIQKNLAAGFRDGAGFFYQKSAGFPARLAGKGQRFPPQKTNQEQKQGNDRPDSHRGCHKPRKPPSRLVFRVIRAGTIFGKFVPQIWL